MSAAVVQPGPLPFEEGEPDRGELWCPGGAPPSGLEFLGCRGTYMCWVIPCPSCLEGWTAVLPLALAPQLLGLGTTASAAVVGTV